MLLGYNPLQKRQCCPHCSQREREREKHVLDVLWGFWQTCSLEAITLKLGRTKRRSSGRWERLLHSQFNLHFTSILLQFYWKAQLLKLSYVPLKTYYCCHFPFVVCLRGATRWYSSNVLINSAWTAAHSQRIQSFEDSCSQMVLSHQMWIFSTFFYFLWGVCLLFFSSSKTETH